MLMRTRGPRCCEASLLPCDEAGLFQRQHHLVNRRRADAEIFLDVGFGRRSAVQPHKEVDIGQILRLLGREGFGPRLPRRVQRVIITVPMRRDNQDAVPIPIVAPQPRY
jgi:hypothetical protein